MPSAADGERWIDHGRSDGRSTPPRKRPPKRSGSSAMPKIELSGVEGLSTSQKRKVSTRLGDAAADFAEERWEEARRAVAPLAERHPGIAEVRELHGLALYRLGRWEDAIGELEAFGDLARSADQYPVLADCHRALGRHERVDELWDELRDWSPGGDVVTEGRIVTAGSLADRGDLRGALRLLERGPVRPKRVKPSTLRLWYAIADLYERSGELTQARDGFRRIAAVEADFGDVAERLDALS
ncbi:MAG: tetratricopeptide repeat protein [Actinomycetota bacterium]